MASLWQKAQEQLSDADQKLFNFNRPDTERRQILEDIVKAVETQNERCLQRRWKITGIGGKEIVLRDVCGKLLSWVNQFLSVVDVVAQYDPIHSSLPWAGIRFFLQLSLKDVKTFDAMIEGLETASRVVARYSLVELLYAKGTSDAQIQLRDQLTSLYAAVLRYLCTARKYYSYNTAKRIIVNALRPPELDQALHQIADQEVLVRRQADLVDTERQLNLTLAVNDIKTAVGTSDIGIQDIRSKLNNFEASFIRTSSQVSLLQNNLGKERKQQLLSWLSCIPYREHHEALSTMIMPGSGQWLVTSQKYVEWKLSSCSHILWMNGPPGCGKTSLMSIIVDTLQKESIPNSNAMPVAFFYCSKNPAEPERMDPCHILRTIAKQLAHPNTQSGILQPAVDMYDQKCTIADQDGLEPSRLTLIESTNLILNLTATTSAAIVIDALDECNPARRYQLLAALEKIVTRSNNIVKILVSSQRAGDINAYLDQYDQVSVSESDNKYDIESFIESQVTKAIQNKRLLAGRVSAALSTRLISILKTKAEGSFRWATLQLEWICDPERVKLEEDVYEVLSKSPTTLVTFYESVHQRILRMEQYSRSIALATFRWLLHARRLLSIEELLSAVSKSVPSNNKSLEPSDILDCCCNLVVADKVMNAFRMSHSTVQDYLETVPLHSAQEADLDIAKCCLTSLIDTWERHANRIFEYAVIHWAVHCEAAYRSCKQSTALLCVFIFEEDYLENWLDALDAVLRSRRHELPGDLFQRLNAVRSTPTSPLFVLACFGLHYVLESDHDDAEVINRNQLNDNGASALFLAARFGQFETVKYLTNQGTKTSVPKNHHKSALLAAAYAGHQEIVMQLIDDKAQIATSRSHYLTDAVQTAVTRLHGSIARTVIDYGYRFPNQESFDRCLYQAIFSGQIVLVKFLVKRFSGIFAPKAVEYPLQTALYRRKERHANNLITKHTSINAWSGFFGNALQAAICGGKLNLVKSLVEREARLDTRGRFGYPLRAAAVLGHKDIVHWLLAEAKADPNVRDLELGDCLQAAAFKGDIGTMLLLVQHKADIEGCGGPYATPLAAACFAGRLDAIRLLLANGAAVRRVNPECRFRNALIAALSGGNQDAILLLVQNGALVVSKLAIDFVPLLRTWHLMNLVNLDYSHSHGHLPARFWKPCGFVDCSTKSQLGHLCSNCRSVQVAVGMRSSRLEWVSCTAGERFGIGHL